MTLFFTLPELICVSDATNLAWHSSDFSSESGASVFPSIWLSVWAAKSFVPHAVARKELVHSFSAWRASCTQEKGAVNIKSSNLSLSQLTAWQSGRKKNCRRARELWTTRRYTQINAKSLPLEAVQFQRLAANFQKAAHADQKNSGAHHFAVEALQDKKKWYCGTMISLCGELGQKQTE